MTTEPTTTEEWTRRADALAELADLTPDVERAIAEAREDLAAGRTTVYYSDEKFEAALERAAGQRP
mgnify:CR=1 FL=1